LAVLRTLYAELRPRYASREAALLACERVAEVGRATLEKLIPLEAGEAPAPSRPRATRSDAGRPRPSDWERPGPARGERCARGHSLDDAIVRANGSRACRTCHRVTVARYEKKRRPRPGRSAYFKKKNAEAYARRCAS